MAEPRTPADLRDERAADRDESADERDDVARLRDETADQRDVEAGERDVQARADFDEVANRFRGLSRQIVDRLVRIAHTSVDPQDWPDLTPAAFALLDAYTAEQRRLAALDLNAVTALFEQVDAELGHIRHGGHAAARDRRASAHDRQASEGNRHDSAQDRTESAGDRSQAVIEREQVDPQDLPLDDGVGTRTSRVEAAAAAQRRPGRIEPNRRE